MADATKIGVADATKMGVANARVAYLLPPLIRAVDTLRRQGEKRRLRRLRRRLFSRRL